MMHSYADEKEERSLMEMQHDTKPTTRDGSMDECLRNCRDCERACTELVVHCLQKGGDHADATHIGILLDCATACRTSAELMMRGSALHPPYCGLCAEACQRCADDCARFENDAAMAACAKACRRCAESCRAMGASRSMPS